MATLRQYYETDFTHVIKIHIEIPLQLDEKIEGAWLVDFLAYASFISCYVAGDNRPLDFYFRLIRALEYGKAQVTLQGNIRLPRASQFPAQLRVENGPPFAIYAQLFGDTSRISANDVPASRRVFIYSETQLSDEEIGKLKEEGNKLGQFRLNVGDNLRDSIEKGLKECPKCIIVLSPHFFANQGWTKKEFDSVFTREILEQKQLVLPIWHGVNKEQVYDYNPSLLNIKGLNWAELGEEEVCRRLYLAVEPKSVKREILEG